MAAGATGLPTDTDLADAARGGDLAAFNRLVDRHQRVVYAVCRRLLGDPDLADDATQDTFIRAYTALHQFDGPSFRPWLLRIATNRCYDLLRQHRRRPAESLDAALDAGDPGWAADSGVADPEREAGRRELGRRLEAALGILDPDQRLVVVLHDVHGFPYDEIAEIARVPLGTVKSRLNRGRARLREVLRQDAGARELLEAVSRQLNGDEHGPGGERPPAGAERNDG